MLTADNQNSRSREIKIARSNAAICARANYNETVIFAIITNQPFKISRLNNAQMFEHSRRCFRNGRVERNSIFSFEQERVNAQANARADDRAEVAGVFYRRGNSEKRCGFLRDDFIEIVNIIIWANAAKRDHALMFRRARERVQFRFGNKVVGHPFAAADFCEIEKLRALLLFVEVNVFNIAEPSREQLGNGMYAVYRNVFLLWCYHLHNIIFAARNGEFLFYYMRYAKAASLNSVIGSVVIIIEK